ncbi:hypothetical protein KCP78_14095 [Salmonella enterica subsp. enterica]|nr:hypothetical protein KCP78_14095 [Salmonella enterica subsp. enterica]
MPRRVYRRFYPRWREEHTRCLPEFLVSSLSAGAGTRVPMTRREVDSVYPAGAGRCGRAEAPHSIAPRFIAGAGALGIVWAMFGIRRFYPRWREGTRNVANAH